jgi:hypothetical protein
MTNALTDAQTIFTILYGIYFAVTVTLTGKLQPFDTPSIYKGNRRALFRLVCSFLLLDVLPLGYLVLVLNGLSKVTRFPFDFCSMLALLMFSLTGFGFYRIYFGLMLLKHNNNYLFYGSQLPQSLEDELKQRNESQKEWKAHVIPGIFWAVITTAWGYVWLLLYKP